MIHIIVRLYNGSLTGIPITLKDAHFAVLCDCSNILRQNALREHA